MSYIRIYPKQNNTIFYNKSRASSPISEIVSVVHQGVITNEDWNWTTVGQELFILTNGELTASDPNMTFQMKI